MADNHHVPRLRSEPIGHPTWGITGLKISRRRTLRERIAGTPEYFSSLAGPKLPAVPDDRGSCAARRGFCRHIFRGLATGVRERPSRVDFGADCLTVLDQIDSQTASQVR